MKKKMQPVLFMSGVLKAGAGEGCLLRLLLLVRDVLQ